MIRAVVLHAYVCLFSLVMLCSCSGSSTQASYSDLNTGTESGGTTTGTGTETTTADYPKILGPGTWSNDAPANGNVTVMTFNVEDLPLPASDSVTGPAASIAAMVKKYSVEVLMMEEYPAEGSDRDLLMKTELQNAGVYLSNSVTEKRTNSNPIFVDNIALFSCYPIVSSDQVALRASSYPSYTEMDLGSTSGLRPVLRVQLELPDGSYLWVLGCHLKATTTSPASDYTQRYIQSQSLAMLVQDMMSAGNDNIIICGDMNTTYDAGGKNDFAAGSTFDFLTNKMDQDSENDFVAVNYELVPDQFTHPSSGGYYAAWFDHIMLSHSAYSKYVSGSVLVVNSPQIADHYPVLISVDVK